MPPTSSTMTEVPLEYWKYKIGVQYVDKSCLTPQEVQSPFYSDVSVCQWGANSYRTIMSALVASIPKLLEPCRTWACVEAVPKSMIGSTNPRPERPRHGRRQNAWTPSSTANMRIRDCTKKLLNIVSESSRSNSDSTSRRRSHAVRE